MPERSPHGAKLPSPQNTTCEYGRKNGVSSPRKRTTNPTPVSDIQLPRTPFKTARLKPGWKEKTNYVIAVGVTATHSPRRITKPYTAFCETKKFACFQKPPEVANSGGPVPVAQSRWPSPGGPVPWPGPGPVPVTCPGGSGPGLGGPVPVPGPGGPVPVAPPGGPVPVARSRSRFKGACPRARAKKDLFC